MSFRVIACTLLLAAPASAQLYEKKAALTESAPLPKATEVRTLTATPERIMLTGGDFAPSCVERTIKCGGGPPLVRFQVGVAR